MAAPAPPCTLCFCGVVQYPTLEETVAQNREHASAVVLGRVVDIENDPSDTSVGADGLPTSDPRGTVVYHLQVKRVWKGILGNGRLSVITADGPVSPCALRLAKDSTYLIYADTGLDGRLYGNTCSRVRWGDSAAADMRLLGAGMIYTSGH